MIGNLSGSNESGDDTFENEKKSGEQASNLASNKQAESRTVSIILASQ